MKTSGNETFHLPWWKKAPMLPFIISLLVGSCSTAWQKNGSYYRTATTRLCVGGAPPGKVYINGRYVGDVPAMVPVEYPQEVERKTRKATYWETQPGEAFLFTIASLGIYFPFSFIPVDTVSSQEPLASFKDNRFSVVVDAGERGKWEKEVVLTGEEELRVEPAL